MPEEEKEQPTRRKGRVKLKFFSNLRGYGFITEGSEGKDIFFRHSEVESNEELQQNDQVEFVVVEEDRGLQAVKVRRVEEEEQK